MILKEIIFEQTEESKRQALKKYLGQRVILEDTLKGWCSGHLLKEESNGQTYRIRIPKEKEPKILYYKHLEKLTIVIDNSMVKISDD
jgi:hypothetical protein